MERSLPTTALPLTQEELRGLSTADALFLINTGGLRDLPTMFLVIQSAASESFTEDGAGSLGLTAGEAGFPSGRNPYSWQTQYSLAVAFEQGRSEGAHFRATSKLWTLTMQSRGSVTMKGCGVSLRSSQNTGSD